MNQPTREEFEEFKQEVKEEVRLLREQITEPIRIDRLEIDRGGTQEMLKETNKKLDQIIQTQAGRSGRFDALERGQQHLEQQLNAHSETWLNTLQENYTEHKQDITDIKTVQSGHSKFFEEHGKRLAATATKDDVTTLRNEMKTTMATKDDIAELKALMMQLLQQKPPES